MAPLDFITTPRLFDVLDEPLGARSETPNLFVLEAAGVLAVDITGAERPAQRISAMRQEGIEVAFARLEAGRAADELEATGLLAAIGPEKAFLTVDEAVRLLAAPPGA